jgi:hypothetical protein
MNEHLTRILKIVSYVALFFCACWFAYLCYQSYHHAFDTTGNHIQWEAKHTLVRFVSIVFFLYNLLTISLIATCFWFFVNILKGIQQEEPFPKKNAIIIFVAAILIFLQTIASDNYNQIFLSEGPAVIKVTSNPFVQALVLIVFGVIYKIASQVAAEHDLTV